MMLTNGKSILKTLVSFCNQIPEQVLIWNVSWSKVRIAPLNTKHIGLETPTQNKQGHVTTQTVSWLGATFFFTKSSTLSVDRQKMSSLHTFLSQITHALKECSHAAPGICTQGLKYHFSQIEKLLTGQLMVQRLVLKQYLTCLPKIVYLIQFAVRYWPDNDVWDS